MRKIHIIIFLALTLGAVVTSLVQARKAVLSPVTTNAIVSPADTLDARLLVLFNLPAEMLDARAIIDFATLHFRGQTRDAAMAQIDVFGVTTDWKDAASVAWDKPWREPGGDLNSGMAPSIYSLKSADGSTEGAIDVTELVRAWKTGKLPNYGLMMTISRDDLLTDRPMVTFRSEGIALKVLYSFEYR